MSYHGGEYIPESYDDKASQAFDDIVSAETFYDIVTPELESLEKLRQDFSQSVMAIVDYADSIKLRSTVDNINRFPDLGDKNIQQFNKYVRYIMKTNDDIDPAIAVNITTSTVDEMASMLNNKSFGLVDYQAPSVDDVMAAIAEIRGYDELDAARVSAGAASVYAEYLSLNMSTYVKYIVETRGLEGKRLPGAQQSLSKLGLSLVAGYLLKKFNKRRDLGTGNE